jgi:hypothetical protein
MRLPAIRLALMAPMDVADDPIGLDAGLMQRLIDANLIGPERSAPLQDQHDLHWPLRDRRNSISDAGASCDIVRPFLHCTSPIAQYRLERFHQKWNSAWQRTAL